jgi:CheY-like chemotaxis protein
VVVLDAMMPLVNGVEATRQCTLKKPAADAPASVSS